MGIGKFFKGLAKVGSFALPFVPIPGLAGNVGLSTAIRGALGAGLGAASGGKKGALMGAASGAGGSLLGEAAKGGLKGFLGKMDPNLLALSGMSLLGGDDGPQERKSFSKSGRTDPKFALNRAMQINDELVQEIRNRMATRSANGPVILPELPTQIGGGLGMDPSKRSQTFNPNAGAQRRKPENG